MKEWLNIETYEYTKALFGHEGWIEIPDGAEFYAVSNDNHTFFNDDNFGMEWFVLWQRQPSSTGLKYDNNKPRYSLLPSGAINSVVSVLEFGAKKYDTNNWQKVDNARERYYNAAMRHIDLWWNGEKCDKETNIHHLAHAATNLFFLMWFDQS